MTAATLMAETPQYVAVELSLDGAVRDAAAIRQTDSVGNRAMDPDATHAIIHLHSGEIDLHPAGAVSSRLIAAGLDIQVGTAAFGSHSHAMVWRSDVRSAVDLHHLLSTDFTDSVATGFDDAGNVTGVAIDAGGRAHDILWKATQERITSFSSGGGGGGTGSGGTGGGGGSVGTDKVSITRALWFGNAMAPPTGELLVQATSSNQNAVLTLSDTTTGQVIAILPNLGGGRYGGSVIFRFSPVTSVTVTSNLGGSNSRAVIVGVQ